MQLVLVTGTPLVQWALPEQVPRDMQSNSSVSAVPRGRACLPSARVGVPGVGHVLPPRAHGRPRVSGKELQAARVSFVPRVLVSSLIEACVSRIVCEGGE